MQQHGIAPLVYARLSGHSWPVHAALRDAAIHAAAMEPLRLADRFVPPNAIEAASITRSHGHFYLFVSLDFCCQGTNSTYKIAVGRSDVVTGPYYDRLGTPLEHGGGTVILSENGTMFGPGGESASPDLLAYHWYDGTANGDFKLGIRWLLEPPPVPRSIDLPPLMRRG